MAVRHDKITGSTFDCWRANLNGRLRAKGLEWDSDVLNEGAIEVTADLFTEAGFPHPASFDQDSWIELAGIVQSLVEIAQVATGVVKFGEALNEPKPQTEYAVTVLHTDRSASEFTILVDNTVKNVFGHICRNLPPHVSQHDVEQVNVRRLS
jgi:hypothetical protein